MGISKHALGHYLKMNRSVGTSNDVRIWAMWKVCAHKKWISNYGSTFLWCVITSQCLGTWFLHTPHHVNMWWGKVPIKITERINVNIMQIFKYHIETNVWKYVCKSHFWSLTTKSCAIYKQFSSERHSRFIFFQPATLPQPNYNAHR